jgi:hypothetical protein
MLQVLRILFQVARVYILIVPKKFFEPLTKWYMPKNEIS